ncbi:MAG: serine/threonine-protein kinase [Polyangiaceae bacterium]
MREQTIVRRADSSLMQPITPGVVVGGDFEVVRPLKEGGMGTVFVALQRSTGRLRALKVLLPSVVATERGLARFEREARIGGEIPSAHVVEVLGAGVDESVGVPWIAMELVDGVELGAFADRTGRLSLEDAAEVARQLSHPLKMSHARGIVHRDLKPENILVGEARTEGQRFMVKIVDFGIALLRGGTSDATASIGTPAWMAPEQADAGAVIDVRADVWAIGLIFFRVLTGRPFWRAAQPDVGSFLRVMSEVCFEPIEPASARAAELGCAPLPAGFDDWFARCVARAPHDRFPTADAALAPLVGLLEAAERVDSVRRGVSEAARALLETSTTVPLDLARSSLFPSADRRGDGALPGVRKEQAYHLRSFAGRSALLERIDAWIDDPASKPCMILTGGPGSGKSALAARIAERRAALLHMVKSHKNPLRFLRALAAQADLVAGAPQGGPPPGDVEDARAELFASVERAVQVRRPLVVVVDGLDELEDPLDVGALPPHWPEGTRVLLTARPDQDLLRAVRLRLGDVEELRVPPLDPIDVSAIVRSRRPDATDTEVQDVSARTGGLPLLVCRAANGPQGADSASTMNLDDVFDDAYRAIARDADRAAIVRYIVVAREALDAVSLAELASIEGSAPSRALLERVRGDLSEMSEYLLEVRSGAFVPWHAGLSDFVRGTILGPDGVREVERTFARWTEPKDGHYTRYALRHRMRHLVAAGAPEVAAAELAQLAFVSASIAAGRVFELVPELDRARSPFAEAIRRHAHFLARHPAALPTVLAGAPATGPWLERIDVAAQVAHAEISSVVGHGDEVWGVDVSADGLRIATASADGTIRLWERESGRELARVTLPLRPNGKRARAFSVAFAPDGSRLYCGTEGQGLVVATIDVRIGGSDESKGVDHVDLSAGPSWWAGESSWCIAVSADGERVAAGSRRGEVRVFGRDGTPLWDIPVGGIVTALAFDARGNLAIGTEWKRLVVAGPDGKERFREVDLPGSPSGIGFVGSLVVAACVDGVVRAWNDRGERVSERGFAGERFYGASFRGDRVALGGVRGVVYVGRSDHARAAPEEDASDRMWSVRAHRASIEALVLLPSGGRESAAEVLTGSSDGTARIVRVTESDRAPFDERVTAIAFTPDGTGVLSGLYDGAVRAHRIGAKSTTVQARRARIHAFAFAADAALVAIGCQDGSAFVARTARLFAGFSDGVADLRAHDAAVNAVAFVPPAGLVATGSSDETLALSTLFGGRVVRRWTHTDSVVAIGADPSGRRLAAAARNGDLLVCDVKGDATLLAMRALPEGQARTITFTTDARITIELRDGSRRAFDLRWGAEPDALASAELVDAPAPIAPGLRAGSDRARAETRLERDGQPIAAYPFALEPCVVSPDGRHVAGWYDAELHVLSVQSSAS